MLASRSTPEGKNTFQCTCARAGSDEETKTAACKNHRFIQRDSHFESDQHVTMGRLLNLVNFILIIPQGMPGFDPGALEVWLRRHGIKNRQ